MTVLTEAPAPSNGPAQAAPAAAAAAPAHNPSSSAGPPYTDPAALDAHVERAWEHFRRLGSPKWHVAPMVDQSELPFRMLCRAHGAQAAYTPMLHARLFLEHAKYREEHFATCEGDRPLFVQFCANDPDVFVAAARLVQDRADYVDLNLGCPQRIAKRGHYGAFLMDHLDTVSRLVSAAASRLATPVSAKIRLFPDLDATIGYARMLQAAGCSLLAVHGRTRDMKDHAAHRADWAAIAAVRAALRIPVLANGDVRCLAEARALMGATGADGVMSAAPLLHNPALFETQEAIAATPLEAYRLCVEYVAWCVRHPTHMRMVRGHVYKLVTDWLSEFPDLRSRMAKLDFREEGLAGATRQLQGLVEELGVRITATGRDHPVPQLSERKLKALEREAARAAAIEEQQREAEALAEIGAGFAGDDAAPGCAGGGARGSHEQQQQQESAQQQEQQHEQQQPQQQQQEQQQQQQEQQQPQHCCGPSQQQLEQQQQRAGPAEAAAGSGAPLAQAVAAAAACDDADSGDRPASTEVAAPAAKRQAT